MSAPSPRGLTGLQSWRSCVAVGVTAGDHPNAPIRGVLVDTDGNYELVMELDTTSHVLPLKAGYVYPFVVRRVVAAAGNVFGGGA